MRTRLCLPTCRRGKGGRHCNNTHGSESKRRHKLWVYPYHYRLKDHMGPRKSEAKRKNPPPSQWDDSIQVTHTPNSFISSSSRLSLWWGRGRLWSILSNLQGIEGRTHSRTTTHCNTILQIYPLCVYNDNDESTGISVLHAPNNRAAIHPRSDAPSLLHKHTAPPL